MDLRNGRTYESVAAARAAGVPESDIAHVVMTPEQNDMINAIPKVEFAKHRPFASFKNVEPTAQGDGDPGSGEPQAEDDETTGAPV